METLTSLIAKDALKWRNDGYKTKFSEVAEILKFQKNENEEQCKFLRKAQFEAIETYLFLRFVNNTPKIIDLYKQYFSTPQDFCKALDINHIPEQSFEFVNSIESVIESVKKEENRKKYKYDSLIETLNLDYSSYILALAMGAGKTNIISAIIAIEFAISMQNENTEFAGGIFMQNALVFAPSLIILKNSLKRISTIPFDKILPPNMCTKFLANVKYIYASSKGELQLDNCSKWNVVITNVEKIILKRNNKTTLFNHNQEKATLEANRRLESIKSLPNLAIFSDEAHHTYGNKIDNELKKVRETINHIHENKELICVVNTTGTPYSNKKMLKDVVFWYGLEEGIKDGILKGLYNGIIEYSFEDKNAINTIITNIINDFFTKYTKGYEKIAFYFKREDQLDAVRPFIESAIYNIKLTNNIILKYNQTTKNNNTEREFLSLDEPENTTRILLLVDMGKEGWDCKTLFATALISEYSTSNNEILQKSTRCLRQIEGNTQNATIYISTKNATVLNKELQSNYGLQSSRLCKIKQDIFEEKEIIVKKQNPPKLEIKIKTRKIVKDDTKPFSLQLTKPETQHNIVTKSISNLENSTIKQTGDYKNISAENNISLLMVASKIATKYHLNNLEVLKQLQKIYTQNTMPESNISSLCQQIDEQNKNYKEIEEVTTRILAIIKTEEGFTKSEDGKYYYSILRYKQGNSPIFAQNSSSSQYGFHYEPYNFDSTPENDFFEKMLSIINATQDQIEDIYFTGGLTQSNKTDFHFEYKGEDNKYHQYYPDFLIRKKTGETYIVEIKAERDKDNVEVKAKQKAVQEIANINENKIKYCVIYTNAINDPSYQEVINFIKPKQ